MPTYAFTANNQQGEPRSGEIVAANLSSALRELELRGLSVRSIGELAIGAQLVAPPKPPSVLVQRIEESLDRRETLIPILNALAEEFPTGVGRRELLRISNKLARGATAKELIDDRSAATWLPLLVGGIASESGTRRLSESILEGMRESERRRRRIHALAYPAILFVVTLLVLGLLCYLIVPSFGNMYREFGLSLPAPTMALVWMSDRLSQNPIRILAVIALAAAAGVSALKLWSRFPPTMLIFGTVVAGNSNAVSAMASFTHSLAEMLNLGSSLPEALRIAGRNCNHWHTGRTANALADYVERNDQGLSAFPAIHALSPSVVRALSAGSNGHPSIPLLRELSVLYSDRVRKRIDWSSSALGPLAVIAVGLFVAFAIISLFMPLVAMISSLA